MIANYIEKVKSIIHKNQSDLFMAATIFLVGIIGFGLGRLSVIWPEKEPIRVENPEKAKDGMEEGTGQKAHEQNAGIANAIQGKYVGSRSGSAYHFPWCPGAQKIKEANKIWFGSKEEAEARGYKPAGNCEGL